MLRRRKERGGGRLKNSRGRRVKNEGREEGVKVLVAIGFIYDEHQRFPSSLMVKCETQRRHHQTKK